jgi:hypothetical protein
MAKIKILPFNQSTKSLKEQFTTIDVSSSWLPTKQECEKQILQIVQESGFDSMFRIKYAAEDLNKFLQITKPTLIKRFFKGIDTRYDGCDFPTRDELMLLKSTAVTKLWRGWTLAVKS